MVSTIAYSLVYASYYQCWWHTYAWPRQKWKLIGIMKIGEFVRGCLFRHSLEPRYIEVALQIVDAQQERRPRSRILGLFMHHILEKERK